MDAVEDIKFVLIKNHLLMARREVLRCISWMRQVREEA